MNKRMQKKVAKRNGGVVVQHSVGIPKRKAAGVTSARTDAGAPARSPGPRAAARALAREVAEVVQERAAGAVKQIKGRIAKTERRAEKLLAKVPGVGPKVAKKLHDVAGS